MKTWRNFIKKTSRLANPLSWGQAIEMQVLISISSHTMSHVLLANLTSKQISYEVSESKRVPEDRLGTEVNSFSYPGGVHQHGSFDPRTRHIVIDAWYKVAFNSEIGGDALGSDPHLQKSIVVEDDYSRLLLSSKLAGSYDWERAAQWAFHLIPYSPRPTVTKEGARCS